MEAHSYSELFYTEFSMKIATKFDKIPTGPFNNFSVYVIPMLKICVDTFKKKGKIPGLCSCCHTYSNLIKYSSAVLFEHQLQIFFLVAKRPTNKRLFVTFNNLFLMMKFFWNNNRGLHTIENSLINGSFDATLKSKVYKEVRRLIGNSWKQKASAERGELIEREHSSDEIRI